MPKPIGEQIKIAHFDRDLAGEPVEPEEQPAQRETPLPVTFNFARPDYEGLGPPIPTGESFTPENYPSTAARETTAGEVARSMRECCMNCTNFMTEPYAKRLALAREAPHNSEVARELRETKRTLIKLRLVSGVTPKQLDNNAEIALNSFGICNAWTEVKAAKGAKGLGEIVHPLAFCPEYFQDRAVAAASRGGRPDDLARHAVRKYDTALNIAAGKKQE